MLKVVLSNCCPFWVITLIGQNIGTNCTYKSYGIPRTEASGSKTSRAHCLRLRTYITLERVKS